MGIRSGPLAIALAALALPAPAPAGERVDVADFARHSLLSDPDVSPRGTWFAAVRQEGRRRSLVFTEVATGKVVSTWSPPGYATIATFYWANEERVVVELADEEGYLALPVSRGELYAVDVNGRGGRLIFGYRAGELSVASRIAHGIADQAWAQVIDPLPLDDRRVLIAVRSMKDVGDRLVRLYRLEVYSGAKTFVTQSPMPETDFLTDENGEPRIAYAFDEKVRMRFFHRDPLEARAGWRELGRLPAFGSRTVPVGFVARDRTLRVVEPLGDGFGLFSVAIDGGEKKALARTRVAPPRTVIDEHGSRKLLAVEYDPDLPAWEFVDREHPVSRTLMRLLAAHPGEHVRLVARTDDDRKAVVQVFSDRDPGQYLVVDVESMAAHPVGAVRPWIAPEAMSRTRALHLDASDGMHIHGYLTLPREALAGPPPPMVVLLHGGPHSARDTWGFDPEVQLLASRGLAVLQVNYRGSGGYGIAYQEAGFRHWGDRVVGDVVDATRHVLGRGLADPRRVCVYGSSFGAYAALQSAVVAPDLFRCAVGDAGIYDLERVSRREGIVESAMGSGFIRTAVGDDPVLLRRASPVYNAASIRARVLLIHGGQDRRAPIEHAELLRDALAAAGNPPEWHVEPGEGHGFYDEGARERMYLKLLAFLRASTGPPAPPAVASGPLVYP